MGVKRSFFTPTSLLRVLCAWSAVVTAPLLLPSMYTQRGCNRTSDACCHVDMTFAARSNRVLNVKVISNVIPHVRRLPPQPTHALSTPSLAWTHNPEGTYTEKLAMARGPKYDDRSHPHCTCNNQDTLSDPAWMYVDSGYHEVQRMERIV